MVTRVDWAFMLKGTTDYEYVDEGVVCILKLFAF